MKEYANLKEIIYDIETSGLDLDSTIWTIGIKSNDTITVYTDKGIYKALQIIYSSDRCIGVNNIKFDSMVLEKQFKRPLPKQIDLQLITKLMISKDKLIEIDKTIPDFPKNLYGSYSLKAFGYRFGNYKGEYDDWTKLTPEMIEYNKQDVNLTAQWYEWCKSQDNYPSEEIIDLENFVAKVTAYQSYYGWYFDIDKAKKLMINMKKEMISINQRLQSQFKPKYLPDGKVKSSSNKRYKKYIEYDWKLPSIPYSYITQFSYFKNGKIKLKGKTYYKWFTTPHKLYYSYVDGEYQPIKLTKFDAGSRHKISIWLQDMFNWKPTVYTPTFNPKVDYDTLENLPYKGTDDLKRYLKLVKDYSQLAGTANSMIQQYNSKTHAVHHNCDTLGTNTGRMSHNKINISQVPSQKEFRELFIAPKGYNIVGADLSGQELRVLAHYIKPYDGGLYEQAVLHGNKEEGTDIHTMNMKSAGLDSRDDAKTLIYAILYGSSYIRIGYNLIGDKVVNYSNKEYKTMEEKVHNRAIINEYGTFYPIGKDYYVPINKRLIEAGIYGKRVYDMFIDKTKGYKELKESIIAEAEKHGKIKALDGRYLPVRSSHSALNLLFQGAGAIITKYWVRETHTELASNNLIMPRDYYPTAIIHDEQNFIVVRNHSDKVGKILTNSARRLHSILPLDVPMDAEYKVGNSWYDVH